MTGGGAASVAFAAAMGAGVGEGAVYCAGVLLLITATAHATGHLLALPGLECYDRVAIGRRLNSSDVSRSLTARTVNQCELECERDMCNGYSFGIASRGNGTCEISIGVPESPPVEDTDFDFFLKSTRCQNRTACFRRFATGRRLADRYIRRTIACQSLRHCEELCAQEESFLCEGFNFRFDGSGAALSSCQLTSEPSEQLDATLDFNADRDYDFFERDRNAPKSCTRPWSGFRPWTQYGSQRFDGAMGGYGGYGVGGYSMHRPPSSECFVRTRPGFRLHRHVVVLAISVPSLWHCETECANERKFVCNVFSYRYSQGPSLPGENCELGERTYRSLDLYTDVVPDRDFDIYMRNEFGRPGCLPKRVAGSDCFERVRSGLGLDNGMTRIALRVNSLQECEQACIYSRAFTCRAFSFRYGAPMIGQTPENCRLTDWPVPEMNPVKHLVDDPGCELYHRASYGHGCELDRPYHAYLPPSTGAGHSYGPPSTGPGHAQFTPSTGNGHSHFPPSIVVGHSHKSPPLHYPPAKYPPTNYGTAPGNSLYYGDHTAGGGGKVSTSSQAWFGTSGPQMYLPPSAYGDTSGLSTRHLDEFCYVSYNLPARLLPKAIHNSLYVSSEAECRAECTRARQRSIFRCASLSYRSTTCELSAIELRDLRPGHDFAEDRGDSWLFSWDFADARCYVPPVGAPPAPGAGLPPTSETWQRFTVSGRPCKAGTVCSINWEVGIWTCPLEKGDWDYCCRSRHYCVFYRLLCCETWQRFTVSGRPCKAGTVCSMNWEVGIWTCPLEEGDWDYCCRSGHYCGYSQGYNYPWCYVGSADRDQWRPCSEHYFPYFPGVEDRPMHWPVAYLHREGPPNMTVPQHQPSIVDNFLQTLRETESQLFGPSSQKGNDSLPEFQVVELRTEQPADTKEEGNAMAKLWTWGQSKYNATNQGTVTKVEVNNHNSTS